MPRKKLSPRQRKENSAARRAYDKRVREAERILAKAVTAAQKLGCWIDEELRVDEFIPPHDPGAYDFDAFTDADKAVYEYEKNGWGVPDFDNRRLAEAVVRSGVPMVWTYSGGSAGVWPPTQAEFKRDGPEVPPWAPKTFG